MSSFSGRVWSCTDSRMIKKKLRLFHICIYILFFLFVFLFNDAQTPFYKNVSSWRFLQNLDQIKHSFVKAGDQLGRKLQFWFFRWMPFYEATQLDFGRTVLESYHYKVNTSHLRWHLGKYVTYKSQPGRLTWFYSNLNVTIFQLEKKLKSDASYVTYIYKDIKIIYFSSR